jgi:hypothetical protein
MDPIFWVLTSLIALLVLVVLLLGLLGIGVWLLRWIGRLWCEGATGDRRRRAHNPNRS